MKLNKAFGLAVAFILSSSLLSHAAASMATTNALAVHGYWDSSIRDHYLSYRTERAANKTPVWWNDFDVDLPYHGIYLDFWSSYVLSETPSEQSANELDLVIGKRGKIGGFSYDTQFRYMDFNHVGTWRDKGDFVGFAALTTYDSLPTWRGNTIQPALDVEWVGRCLDMSDGGVFVQPGFIHKWKAPFGIKCLTLVDKNWFSWDCLPFKNDDVRTFFFRTDTAMVWTLNKHLSWSMPGVRVITPVINTSDGRKADVSLWAGIRVTF